MDIAEAIRAELGALLRRLGHPASRISASDGLTTSLGLSSFDVLALVPRLNSALEVDPFKETLAITDIRTVGDLVRAYEAARATRAGSAAADNPLRASANRAARRRLPGES